MHAPSPPPPFSSSCATTSDDTICYHHLLWLWLLLFTALCTVIEVHLHVLLRAFAYSGRGSSASTGNCHLNWWHSHSGFFFSSSGYDFYSLKSWPCVGIRLFMISPLSVTWWVNEWIVGESEGDDGQKESPKMDLGWKFGSEFLSHGLNINNRFRPNGNTFGCEVLWCVCGSGIEHNRIKLYISAISNHHPAMTDILLIAPSSSYHSTSLDSSQKGFLSALLLLCWSPTFEGRFQ